MVVELKYNKQVTHTCGCMCCNMFELTMAYLMNLESGKQSSGWRREGGG